MQTTTNPLLRLPTRQSAIFGMIVSVAFCCVAGGCGNDLPARYQVQGHVNIDGQPLEKGLIIFIPIAPTAGPKASGVVNQGKYIIEQEAGPCLGEFLVKIETVPYEIEAIVAKRNPSAAATARDTNRPVVAPQYNQASQLRATVREDAENRFNFEVESVEAE